MWLIKDAKDKDTYCEGTIKPSHVLYDKLTERVCMLNMARVDGADDMEVPGVGIVFRNGQYAIQLSDEEHAELCKGA
jgi:hypothetical protein